MGQIRPKTAFLLLFILSVAGCDDPAGEPGTGFVRVLTVTGGATPDKDGYTVNGHPLPLNGTTTVGPLSAGVHQLHLAGVAINCTITGGAEREVELQPWDTVEVAFEATCPLALDGHLVFWGQAAPVWGNLYRAEADGSGVIELGNPEDENHEGAVSPDNTAIAYIRQSPLPPYPIALSLMAPDGSWLRDLPTPAVSELYEPIWSPDGSRVVMTGVKYGTGWGLYISEVNGTGAYPITDIDLSSGVIAVGWSADGAEVLFTAYDSASIYSGFAAADGSGWRPGWIQPGDYPLDWSADGERILFTRLHRLYSIRPDGTGLLPLISDSVRVIDARISPSDGRIAFYNALVDSAYVMNGEGQILGPLPRRAEGFKWTPDGSKITFRDYTLNNGFDIFAADPDGSNVVDLTNRPSNELHFSWARKL